MRQGVVQFDVEVADGQKRVQLPNGFAYDGPTTVRLTEHQASKISPSAFDTGVLAGIEPVSPVTIGGREYEVSVPATPPE